MRFRLRLLVLGPHKAALDAHGAIMIEDDKGPATRDVGGVIGLTLGLKPLDLSFKLAETRIDFVGQFLRALMLLRQAVELGLRGIQGGLIFRRQVHCLRIGPAQPVAVRVVEEDLRPFPALRFHQCVGFASKLGHHQHIEQRHVLEIAAAILGEEIAQDRATNLGILFRADKDRAAIRGGDMGFGEHAADRAGIAVIGQPLIGGLLPGMVLGNRKGHQLVKRQIAVAVDLHQLGRYRAQAKPLPHHMRRHAEPGGDFFRAETAFFGELLERLELVGGMHVLARDIFVEADFVRIVRGVDDAADRFGLFDLLALDAQKLRQPAAFADGDEIEPGCRAIRVQFRLDDKVLQNALRGDAGRHRPQSTPRCAASCGHSSGTS